MVSSIKWFHATPDNLTITLIKVLLTCQDLVDDELVNDLLDDPLHDHDLLHRRRPLQATLTST